ncbi:MAG: hypothetical protein M3N51_11230 [Actinomycetota bacterium]|nr:hypothetical protein [Actinomycetota bacterium]
MSELGPEERRRQLQEVEREWKKRRLSSAEANLPRSIGIWGAVAAAPLPPQA